MLYQVLIPALIFLTVLGIGGSIVTAIAARREPLRDRLFGGAPPAGLEVAAAGKRSSPGLLERLGKLVSGKGPSKSLKEELLQAGYHDTSAATVFLGAKAVLFGAGLLASGLALYPAAVPGNAKLAIVFFTGFLFSLLPNAVVKVRRAKRTLEVRLHLPDAIDLLEICVSSGMGLDMAWNSVAGEARRVSTIMADEMALANLEIHLGADRASALRHLAERTGAEEISSLVATLVQSERFGTSIADALKTFAESMREERSQKAEEAAEKMSVKLLFPMVVFIFPAMLLVCAGSAFIQIFQILGGRN